MSARGQVPVSFLLPAGLRNPVLPIAIAKELREILPYAVVSAATGLLWLVGFERAEEAVAMVLMLVGELATVAMGAAVFGHEFTHRTLGQLLVQPLPRAALWRRKMRVLAATLGGVLVLRLAGLLLNGANSGWAGIASWFALYGALACLCLAPCLTLLSRSTLAGLVFAAATPAVTWQAGALISVLRFGVDNLGWGIAQEFTRNLFIVFTALECVAGLVLTRTLFLRIQVTDSRGAALRLPGWLRRVLSRFAALPAGGGVHRRLLAKELRLLSPAFLVAGVYLLLCAADLILLAVLQRSSPAADVPKSWFTPLATFIYAALVSLLIGALTCTEERHAGTQVGQLVQPLAMGRQWLVKTAAALGTTWLLAVGLPLLIQAAGARLDLMRQGPVKLDDLPLPEVFFQVTVLCVLGIYFSSLAATTLRAMLCALPVAFVLEVLYGALKDRPDLQASWIPGFALLGAEGFPLATWQGALQAVVLAACTLLPWIAVPLGGALQNYRRLDLRPGRVLGQVGLFALALAVAALVGRGMADWASTWEMPPAKPSREDRLAAECDTRMALLQSAAQGWYMNHNRQLPPNLEAIATQLGDETLVRCPQQAALEPATEPGSAASYLYVTNRDGEGRVLAEIRCPVHESSRLLPVPLARRFGPPPPAPAN